MRESRLRMAFAQAIRNMRAVGDRVELVLKSPNHATTVYHVGHLPELAEEIRNHNGQGPQEKP